MNQENESQTTRDIAPPKYLHASQDNIYIIYIYIYIYIYI